MNAVSERIKDTFYLLSRVDNWREVLRSKGKNQFATWKLRNGSSFRAQSGTGDIIAARDTVLRNIYPLKKSYGLVVDIGAQIGTFVARVSPRAERVIAFEPVTRNFNLLKDYCATNKRNVEIHKLAITSDGRDVVLNLLENTAGHSIYAHEPVLGQEVVPSIASSALLNFLKVDLIDLLKMDVEGAEYEIMENGAELLKASSEILLEAHELGGHTLEEAKAYLESAGFRIFTTNAQRGTCVYHGVRDSLHL
ncbi:MAG TPA: FkbM family methyltransferase [Pyrinomonadaceae bacterium]|jgi:FkbM family methyltransferase|nr:FkbM family methyltransferase [Pyrinomonadaceae bacterium]